MTALLPYQEAGAEWLQRRRRAYLGDEPGLGKTRTLLRAVAEMRATRPVVICPAIARTHWEREAKVLGLDRDHPTFPLVLSYEAAMQPARWDEIVRCSGRESVLILDEAHYLKHRSSQRTQAILGPKTGLARLFGHVWCASGTPMPRNPAELFAVLVSLFADTLRVRGIKSFEAFLDRYCVWRMGPYGPRIYGERNRDDLQTILGQIMLRRTADGVALDLPDISWGVRTVDVSSTDRREYDATEEWLEDEDLLDIYGGVRTTNTSALRRIIGEAKAATCADMIADELDEEPEKRVVFAYHHTVLDILQERLAPFGVMRVDGNTSQPNRAAKIDAFQKDEHTRVFLGQITACSTAITLTAARRVDIVEPDWRSDVNVQAGKRIHRLGQHRPCFVRFLAMGASLDETIIDQHHRETAMVGRVVG